MQIGQAARLLGEGNIQHYAVQQNVLLAMAQQVRRDGE